MNRILRSILIAVLSSTGPCGAAGEVVQMGEFEVTHALEELINAASTEMTESIIAPDEPISWEIYVPESYSSERPAGLLVYVSPSPSGEIPSRWKSVLDDHNLIWISANNSGNRVLLSRRVLFAIVGPTVVKQNYVIDDERIYVSGLSGGGKTASMVAIDHAKLFKGAIYNCGVEAWRVDQPEMIEQIRTNHYVFVTGDFDQALESTKRVYRAYKKAGIGNSKLMVIRNMGHQNPERHEFDKAIRYLDSRLPRNDQ